MQIAPVGRGEIMVIGARTYFDFGLNELRQDPWLTAKGPAAAAEVIFRMNRSGWRRRGGSREGRLLFAE